MNGELVLGWGEGAAENGLAWDVKDKLTKEVTEEVDQLLEW